MHTNVPAVHAPTQFAIAPPGQFCPHGPPTSVGLSSTVKSQSSSMPSHTSGGNAHDVLSQSFEPVVTVVDEKAQ